MNKHLVELLESEYINNPDFIEGMREGLRMAQTIGEQANMPLGSDKEFYELTGFLEKHSGDLPL